LVLLVDDARGYPTKGTSVKVSSPAVWRLSLFAVILLTVLMAALAVNGAAAGESSPPPDEKITLRIGWLTEPDNLNPFVGIQGSSYMMWKIGYDFLVGFDDQTLEPRP
jgi:ABC-type transport system substrate-binding protein